MNSLFKNIPKSLPNELFEEILQSKNFKIKRIISKGHTTPKSKWYDQNENELAILIKGSAELLFENNKRIKMQEGDYINIPSHTKHRIEKTDPKGETIWLAVFYK